MPLFRFHRGSLEESLKTTVIIKNFNDLTKYIVHDIDDWIINQHIPLKIIIEPYPDEKDNFDSRIGWYTHIVRATLYEKDVLHVIGFLSENVE
jgi:hypothetical protein